MSFRGEICKIDKKWGFQDSKITIADTALNFYEYIARHVNYNRFSQFSHLGLGFAIIQAFVKS